MIKRLILPVLILLAIFTGSSLLVPQTGFAQQSPFEDVCSKAGGTSSSSTVCQGKDTATNPIFGPGSVLVKVTSLVAMVTGVVAVIVIIISGIRIIVSSGDPNTLTASRNALLYAVVGLIVAISAQGIVVFVLNKL